MVFEQHKGYGTAAHRKALHAYGATPVHRELFFAEGAGLSASSWS